MTDDYLRSVAWAHGLVAGALAPREVVRDAERAIQVEFDEGRVICRHCSVVMETDESGGWEEGRPLCVSCWREAVDDKADFEHGGEA